MPIYEYQCTSCEHQLEALQKISEQPLVDCPSCNKADLKKKISAAGFRLKGGGWYETDFKTGSKKNVAGGSDAGSSSSAG
ncbi:zinc ribbon domain-containing protein [Dasania sp. GY-MA-18]|uniref:Zinc ribbon domain-containing protein n=1 Tax=Dasania phycosphaerae TaxID=2950436 RepID=A0A9J6RGK1_9GAMM|nr:MULTISPECIES: zinc ribbon domain-containing protein [Dasania]MCR8921151.1 zinc ribbon domain-containing protein [Dasania sp. GY-MA-18]MCZ0863579.1 zinc ribbon domain-containing protein [Dasania phycosphaerae]MCZ0867307.1 zinc ribbon domain-containing protein [Dasania phycosphaerae]